MSAFNSPGLYLLVLLAATSRLAGDALYAAFREPAAEARPFARWWWNGGRVERTELARELEVMESAGLGGVEINTIAMPDGASAASMAKHRAVAWLSPEWNELVRHAADVARDRGMAADLIVGSGWPFGGRFLSPGEQSQRVLLVKRPLSGPARLVFHRDELLAMKPPPRPHTEHNLPPPTQQELLFLRLAPARADKGPFAPGHDLLTSFDSEDRVVVVVPAGEHVLYVGTRQTGFTHVKLGAPGADGPVINHFDAGAVRKYLDHMTEKLAPALGGSLGGSLRAVFVDSLELDHANWTNDLTAEFQRRRGYDLLPYLPFALDEDGALPAGEFRDTIRRARHDFCRTLIELFDERFLDTYRAWAAANGVKARIQAYGRETHPLHGSMQADLPEGETWLWVDKDHPHRLRVDSTVINKYVASAANLTGQRVRSFEAMTNAVPVFRENLEDFKRAFDATLLTGLNHPIIHGFNYTPPDAGFPGWVRFGSYLNERSPWWPHFRRFTDYAARLGTVMRRSEARARVAVLAPRADEWARHGLLYQPFPEVVDPWYQFKLIDAIQQAGYNADYISDRILVEGTKTGARLRYGPCAYEVVVVMETHAMEPAAAAGLADFAAAGGRVVFIGAPPAHSPGLHRAAEQDVRVRAALAPLRQPVAGRVFHYEPPRHGTDAAQGADEDTLLRLAQHMLGATGLVPDVQFERPQRQISQLTHWDGARAIYFIVNSDPDASHRLTLAFPGATGRPYQWDPETGTKKPLAIDEGGKSHLELDPAGSALIVFSPEEVVVPIARRQEVTPSEPRSTLTGPWQLRLNPAGTDVTIDRVLPTLVDLSQQQMDEALRSFGGVATYVIEWDGGAGGGGTLDLGEVHGVSEVILNSEMLGARWWGLHRYPLGNRLKPGRNHLQVKVSTILANLMRHKTDDASAQRWASWAPPIPTGLVGPVRLLDSAEPIPPQER